MKVFGNLLVVNDYCNHYEFGRNEFGNDTLQTLESFEPYLPLYDR